MKTSEDYQFLSTLERLVWAWLEEHDIPFSYQQRMFGQAAELGTAVVDFIIPERNLALRCMGSYWHSSMEARARDQLGKERLIAEGYIVVDLWEEHLTDNIDRTMQLALQGIEVPK